jgi:hypothetical protein
MCVSSHYGVSCGFSAQGDDALGVERVRGGAAVSCTRGGHGDEAGRVGDVGFYDSIKTFRKVNGVLASHCNKEEHLKTRAEARAIRESHLSILMGSPTYLATNKLGAAGGNNGDDPFVSLEEWVNHETEEIAYDGNMPGEDWIRDRKRRRSSRAFPRKVL